MEDHKPSMTALATARMRTIHTQGDPRPIIADAWGSRLAPATTLSASLFGEEIIPGDGSTLEEAIDALLRESPAYANVILRSCYTEDALKSAIAEGVGQYVIVGAGYDSFALRRPAEAEDLEVFEVDHPATQTMKLEQLAACDALKGDKHHFVAADLGTETIESALSNSTFRASERAFLSWLGVTMYLSREANMATLGSIAQYCAPGSLLVFSYVDQAMFEPASTSEAESFAEMDRRVSSVGEPFVSGFHPQELEQELGRVGLELEENLNDAQVLERFDPAGVNNLKPGARSHIALVRVLDSA